MEIEIQHGGKEIKRNDALQEAIENRLKYSELFVVDRIEQDQIVCENRSTQEMITIPKDKFSWQVKEGDVFQRQGSDLIKKEQEQQNIEKRIQEKMKGLWN